MKTENDEGLESIGKRLRKAMGDAAVGPLIAASEIVKLSERWDAEPPSQPLGAAGSHAIQTATAPSLRQQAGGSTCDRWIRDKVAPGGLAFFAARNRAVIKLGEFSRRTVHHEVAVWVDRNVADAQLDEVKLALMRGARAQGGNPLTPAQARRTIDKILGRVAAKKAGCARCRRLEKILAEAGVDIQE